MTGKNTPQFDEVRLRVVSAAGNLVVLLEDKPSTPHLIFNALDTRRILTEIAQSQPGLLYEALEARTVRLTLEALKEVMRDEDLG